MRSRIIAGTFAAAALAASAIVPASAAPGDSVELNLLATTDVHGHVMNWDYFRDAPYPEGKELGLARVDSIIQAKRAAAKSPDSVLVVDNGDAIQGTPLTYLAMQKDKLGLDKHPMATAFNLIGYDALVVGNHEYNYGLDKLAKYESELDAPLLGANVIDVATGKPAHKPYQIFTRTIDGHEVKVGVLGLVTPGVRVWDKALVDGKREFRDVVETAQKVVPQMKSEGADIVIALAHTGQDPEGAKWDPKELGENVARSLATNVNDLDVVVAGHSHVENAMEKFQAPDGDTVLLTQPKFWAQSVSDISLNLVEGEGGKWSIDWDKTTGVVHPASGAKDSPRITENADLAKAHKATIEYVNTVVAQSTEEMKTDKSRYEDTPILDLIGHVMVEKTKEALAKTKYADLPVIAQTSPFSRESVFPKGDVTIKDIAGLYIYDNTLAAVKINGAGIKEYLEYSARYFCQVEEGATFDPETGTNCKYPGQTRGIPDYNFDALSGVHYEINISKPVGERIENLRFNDKPVADGDEFILAVNNYRQNGGGGYPVAVDAPEVWNDLLEIRQLIIDWAEKKKVIDPKDFFEDNWKLVTKSVAPSPDPTNEPTEEPTEAPTPTEEPTQAPTDGPTTHPTDPGKPKPTSPTKPGLPVTGSDAGSFAFGASALLLGGLALLAANRKRVLG